jgi:tRNA threonylcarbamoyladenosine biosynthesis protein TsaB
MLPPRRKTAIATTAVRTSNDLHVVPKLWCIDSRTRVASAAVNILCFDTSFDACSVAVAAGLGTSAERIHALCEPMRSGQAERLIPMIEETLRGAGIGVADIDRIAAGHGPGTFTGTRIAVSAARALSLATGRPVAGFSSLNVIACHPRIALETAGQDILVAMNANRGEVYCQIFEGRTREARTEPMLLGSAAAIEMVSDTSAIVAGSGVPVLTEAATGRAAGVIFGPADLLPDVRHILQLAARMPPLAVPLRPLYLRPPDAAPQAGKSLGRAP